jgi:hypothetical protein
LKLSFESCLIRVLHVLNQFINDAANTPKI